MYTIIYKCKNKNCLIDSGPSSYTSRMAGFFLYVSNTTSKEDGHLCFHEIQTVNGTPSEDQRIHCSVHGRYVIYYNERKVGVTYPSYYSKFAYYELCELEVYGEYPMVWLTDQHRYLWIWCKKLPSFFQKDAMLVTMEKIALLHVPQTVKRVDVTPALVTVWALYRDVKDNSVIKVCVNLCFLVMVIDFNE